MTVGNKPSCIDDVGLENISMIRDAPLKFFSEIQ